MKRRRQMIVVLACGLAAACGGDGGNTSPDTASPADTGDAAAEVGPDDASDAAAEVDDAGADALEDVPDDVAPDAAEVVADADAAIPDAPLDRNCEYDPRFGNARDPELRCKPCRSVVGILGQKVQVVLLWSGTYTAGTPVEGLCDAFPGVACTASVVAAEVMFCKNLDTGKERVVWSDIAEVTRGEGEALEVGEARGPTAEILLGSLSLQASQDAPMSITEAFVPAKWVIHDLDEVIHRVEAQEGRTPALCPVGKFSLGGPPLRLGETDPCAKAYQSYGSP